MKIVSLDQRSSDWDLWRLSGIGASEIAQVFNKSPFGNAQRLYERKLLLRGNQKENKYMLRGRILEPEALSVYESNTGNIMIPVCAEHSEYSFIKASLDGFSSSNGARKVVEIKNPSLRVHEMAIRGIIPEYYNYQCQQQALVAEVDEVDYFSYCKDWPDPSKRAILLKVYRSELIIQDIIKTSAWFWERVLKREPLYSDNWEPETHLYKILMKEKADLDRMIESSKKSLISMSSKKNMEGNGVTVYHYEKKGSLNTEAMIEGEKMDPLIVEKYRGPSSTVSGVRLSNESAVVYEGNKSTIDLIQIHNEIDRVDPWGI